MPSLFCRSGQNAFDDVGFLDAGKFHVQAAELIGEALVINAQAVENRRVQVSEVYAVFGDIVGEIIRRSVFEAGLDAAAGEEHGEASAVVVTPAGRTAKAALGEGGTTELSGKDD